MMVGSSHYFSFLLGLSLGYKATTTRALLIPTPTVDNLWEEVNSFKNKLNLSPHITGTVPVAPRLKVSPPRNGAVDDALEKSLIFVPPYENSNEMYGNAMDSQVGIGSHTLFRRDTRQSKEFDCVEVISEEWEKELQNVCNQVKAQLAPSSSAVFAELHKLIIYSEGDFFRPHRDAQHDEQEFATLLFFLPGEYDGGDFRLLKRLRGINTDHEWMFPGWADWSVVEDQKKPNSCTWVSFYTDHEHEVAEVTGGFRVVLSYKLKFEGSMCPSPTLPAFPDSLQRSLLSYFHSLSARKDDVCGLAFPLLYHYTEKTMFPSFLKGADAVLFNALSDIGKPELMHSLRIDKIMYDESIVSLGIEMGWDSFYESLYLVDSHVLMLVRKIQEEANGTKKKELKTLLMETLSGSCRENKLDWLYPSYWTTHEIPHSAVDFLTGGSSPLYTPFDSEENTPSLGNYGVPRKFFYLDLTIVLHKDSIHTHREERF